MCPEGRSYFIIANFDKIQHNHRTFSPIISDHFSHKSSIFSVNSVVVLYGEVFPKIVDFLSISDFVGGICNLGAKSRLYRVYRIFGPLKYAVYKPPGALFNETGGKGDLLTIYLVQLMVKWLVFFVVEVNATQVWIRPQDHPGINDSNAAACSRWGSASELILYRRVSEQSDWNSCAYLNNKNTCHFTKSGRETGQ